MTRQYTAAQLRPHGWTAALIFRGVDRGLLRPRQCKCRGWGYWEFSPARGRSWAGARAEVQQDIATGDTR